jgi:WD40 repeat protein/class 3 adenylate cyclase
MSVVAVLFVREVGPPVLEEAAVLGRGRVVNVTPERAILAFDSVGAGLHAGAFLAAAGGAVGLEVGEPVWEHGEQLYGLCVWVAARLSSAAQPGQVVVSGLARRVSGLPEEDFTALGTRTLKGIPDPVEVLELNRGLLTEPDRRTWALLCVDQVGSTAQMAGLGDARAGHVHVAMLDVAREAAAERSGEEVEYAGDGLVFRFPSVVAALDAATVMLVGAQRFSLRHPDEAALRLCAGVDVSDDPRVARAVSVGLCATADPGEVIVSEAVFGVAGPRALHEFDVKADGTRYMRWSETPTGLALPEALAQVEGEIGFVGRESEFAVLGEKWEAAASGLRGCVLVSGDAGAGKTALVRRFVSKVADADSAVLVLHADAAGTTGWSALARAWEGYLRATPRAELREQLKGVGSVVATVLPVLRERIPDLAMAGPADPALVAQSMEVFATRVSADYPVLLVLDNVESADAELLAVLRALARGTTPAKLLTLVVARTPELGQSDVAAELGVDPRRTAAGEPGFAELVVRGLGTADVAALLREVLGQEPEPEVLSSVDGETAGLPGLVLSYARNLAGRRSARGADRTARLVGAARLDLDSLREDIVSDLRFGRSAGSSRPTRTIDPEGTPPADIPCPYKGLASFDEHDAGLFRGREELLAQLLARLLTTRLITVVGASGSGKSSLVRAGLLPAVFAGLLGDGTWETTLLVPGTHPSQALAAALGPPARGRRLLVVDQFEEVFGSAVDETERDAVIAELLALAADDAGTLVVLVLRADFYGQVVAIPELAAAVSDSQLLVGPMTQNELRAAIEEPAREAGLVLEAGLTDAIVYDVSGEDGALPLVSTVLVETWQRRRGRSMTLRGYAEAGGVRGAVARLAEDTYAELSPEEQQAARDVFLRLAETSPHGQEVRRRAHRTELDTGDPAVGAAVKQLVANRLLTATEDTLEVAHEALLREWPRLREWLAVDRDHRRQLQELATSAADWEAHGRDPERLARGTRLDGAVGLAELLGPRLTPTERAYVETSVEQRTAELNRERRANRRLRRLLAGAVAFAVLAVAAGGVAFRNQRQATRNQRQATAASLTADAERLGAQARLVDDPKLGLLLAAAGYRLEDSPATRSNLLSALVQHDGKLFSFATGASVTDMALGAGDGLDLVRYQEGERWSIHRRAVVHPIALQGPTVQSITAGSDGNLAVVSHGFDAGPTGFRGSAGFLSLGREEGRQDFDAWKRLPGLIRRTVKPAWVGSYLFAVTADGSGIARYDVRSPRRAPKVRAIGQRVSALAVSSRGVLLASEAHAGASRITTLDPDTLTPQRTFVAPRQYGAATALATAASGARIALGFTSGRVVVLPSTAGSLAYLDTGLVDHVGAVRKLAFSPDSSMLASGGDDGRVLLFRSDAMLMRSFTAGSAVTSMVWGHSPTDVYVGTREGLVMGFDADARHALARFIGGPLALPPEGTGGLKVSHDGRLAVRVGGPTWLGIAGFYQQWITALDLGSGAVRRALTRDVAGETANFVITADGSRALAIGQSLELWDLRTFRSIQRAPLAEISNSQGRSRGLISRDGKHAVLLERADPTAVVRLIDLYPLRVHANVPLRGGPTLDTSRRFAAVWQPIRWSDDQRRLLVACGNACFVSVDTRTGDVAKVRDLTDRHTDFNDTVDAFSADGHQLVQGVGDGSFRLFTGTDLAPTSPWVQANGQSVVNAGFTSDGKLVVVGGADGTLSFWNASDGTPFGLRIAVGSRSTSTVDMAMLPDDRVLVADERGTARIVPASAPGWKALACTVAGRELTHDEWDKYLPNRQYRSMCT